MGDEPQNLTAEEKELVAVGAGVGAGCQPCVDHHLKAGAQAGLDRGRLLAAVTSAERVAAEAAVTMGDHVRAQLAEDVTPALLSRLEEVLASLGAALGANDKQNIERQLRAALELGATRALLEEAIETSGNVQENASRIHIGEAERLLDELAAAAVGNEAEAAGSCGCGGEDGASAREGAVSEPVAASGDPNGGCWETMASRFGTAGETGEASAAMAGCRQMFERVLGSSGSIAKDKTPAAPVATGQCRTED